MPRGNPQMRVTMSIPVDQDLYTRVRTLSVRTHIAMADIVRRAMEAYIAADAEYWLAVEAGKDQKQEGKQDA